MREQHVLAVEIDDDRIGHQPRAGAKQALAQIS